MHNPPISVAVVSTTAFPWKRSVVGALNKARVAVRMEELDYVTLSGN